MRNVMGRYLDLAGGVNAKDRPWDAHKVDG
jgi:hypothetical protein